MIELLISVALIIVMFVMLHGHGSKSHQRKQMQACRENLQTLYVSLQIFANDHEGAFPMKEGARRSGEVLEVLVPRYTSRITPFFCPGSQDAPPAEGESIAEARIGYAYFMGRKLSDGRAVLMSDEQVNDEPKEIGSQVFSGSGDGPGSNHNKYGGNFLHCDGEVESSVGGAPFPIDLPAGVRLLNPGK